MMNSIREALERIPNLSLQMIIYDIWIYTRFKFISTLKSIYKNVCIGLVYSRSRDNTCWVHQGKNVKITSTYRYGIGLNTVQF